MADRPMTDDDIEGSKGGARSVAVFSIVAVALGILIFIFAADVFHLAGNRPGPVDAAADHRSTSNPRLYPALAPVGARKRRGCVRLRPARSGTLIQAARFVDPRPILPSPASLGRAVSM